MKKLMIVLLIALMVSPLVAEGTAEGAVEPWDWVVTVAGGRGDFWQENVYDGMLAQYPDLSFEFVDINQVSGDNITMAALMAANTPPDIYLGFAGRAGEYLVSEYALPLDIDESVWDPAILATYKRYDVGSWLVVVENAKGELKETRYVGRPANVTAGSWEREPGIKLYGLPFSLPVQGMAINTDVTTAAGYAVPDGAWDTADYLEMLEAIKSSGQEVHPTFLYAGSPSADYFWLGWFGAFGVELFDADYTRSTFNDTPAGVEVMAFLQELVKAGYSPEDSAIRTVNEVLPGWKKGSIATTGYRPNWIPSGMERSISNGVIDKAFNYIVKPFPTAPGVAWPAPIPGVGTCVIGHVTDNAQEEAMITEIVLKVASIAQSETVNDILTRTDIVAVGDIDPTTAEIIAFTLESGFMDPGYTYEWYGETRACALPILRDLYNGVSTPEEAAAAYEKAVNEILADYK